MKMALDLHATEYGNGSPVLVLHGLFGSGRNWAAVCQKLAGSHHVLALDLRNHGVSPWAAEMSYADMAEDVAALIRARDLGRVALLGHSMGGKVAMVLALTRPELVARIVVVDVAPTTYEPVLLSYVRAMLAIDLASVCRRSDAEAGLESTVPDPAERGFLLQNLVLDGDRARWRINLPVLDQALPAIASFPELPASARYDGPALFVAGERSNYVRPEHEPSIRHLFPRAEITRIAGAGHWVHAEQPKPFLEAVAPFLAE
jgi:esterase